MSEQDPTQKQRTKICKLTKIDNFLRFQKSRRHLKCFGQTFYETIKIEQKSRISTLGLKTNLDHIELGRIEATKNNHRSGAFTSYL